MSAWKRHGMLILELVGFAGVIGLVVAAVVHRWPWRDPAAPKLASPDIRATVYRHPRLRALIRSRVDPTVTTGLALTVTVLIFVAAATSIGILAAMVRANVGFVHYDPQITVWASKQATKSSTSILRFISQFGGAWVVIPLGFVVAAFESIRLRSRAVWVFLSLVIGGQFMVANTIKFIVDRARPTVDQLTGFSGTSFPSGHATAAAATYIAFALLLGKRRSLNTRAILSGSAVAVAILIGGTRVMLGVHWLTDVVAGLVLGWAWFTVCSYAFGGRLLRFGAPVETAAQAASSIPVNNP